MPEYADSPVGCCPPPQHACLLGWGRGCVHSPPDPRGSRGAGGIYPAVGASPCVCVMSPAGGGPNWFSRKSAVASTSSNVTLFSAVGRASPPPPLPFPLDSPPRKLLNMFYFRQELGAPVAVLGKVRIDVVRVGLVLGALVAALVRGRTRRRRRRAGSNNKEDNIADDHRTMPDPRRKGPEVGVGERKTGNLPRIPEPQFHGLTRGCWGDRWDKIQFPREAGAGETNREERRTYRLGSTDTWNRSDSVVFLKTAVR